MSNVTVQPSVNLAVDLRFYEGKIRDCAMGLADGFRQIHSRQLWKAHSNNYRSFEDYINGEWSNYSYIHILNTINASSHRHTLEATVTSSGQSESVPLPSNPSQVKELKASGKPADDQVELWQDIVEKHGDSPTVSQVKEAVQEAVQATRDSFPIGSAIIVNSGRGLPYEDSEGYVMGYEGNGNAVCNLLVNGDVLDNMTIPLMWLRLTDKPPIEVKPPTPAPKPKKRSSDERLEVAIALLRLVLLEQISDGLRSDVVAFLGE